MESIFSRSRGVCAASLFLIGYKLFPRTVLKLHPQFTVIAGGNGVGKTTVLDALQTVIIGDQRVLRFNVASGQDDRDLSGQMMDRVAWAVLAVEGHLTVKAIGVHLERQDGGDQVVISPFVLEGIDPEADLFLDAATGQVTPGIGDLARHVTLRELTARVVPFDSIGDYHNHLFREGVLSIDLSRANRHKFASLWKQATRPHMAELHRFLQEVLCHQPSKKVSFKDVEKLMQDRRRVEGQFEQLEKLKLLHDELTGLATEMDTSRRRALGGDLWACRQKESEVANDIASGKRSLDALGERARSLDLRILEMREHLEEIGSKRDVYIREQGDLDRKLKHFREYEKQQDLMKARGQSLLEVEKEIPPLEAVAASLERKEEELRNEIQHTGNEIARLTQEQAELEEKLRKWKDLEKILSRARDEMGVELQAHVDVEKAWLRVNEEKREVDGLKSLKELLGTYEDRAKAHLDADRMARRMIDLWPVFFSGKSIAQEALDQAGEKLEAQRDELNEKLKNLQAEAGNLASLMTELSRGRIDLPPSARRLVDAGLAKPFSARYEDLEEDEARVIQQEIGPLLSAIEPHADTDPTLLAEGAEPYLLVLPDDSRGGSFQSRMRALAHSEAGALAGAGPLAWYTPNGPVLLGAKAREARKLKTRERLNEIEAEIKTVREDISANAERSGSVRKFLPMLAAYADESAEAKTRELAERVKALEAKASVVKDQFNLLRRALEMKDRFAWSGVRNHLERVQKNRADLGAKSAAARTSLSETEAARKEKANDLSVLRARASELGHEIKTAKTLCEQLESEEPEEVLRGQVDFGRAGELRGKVEELDREKTRLVNRLGEGEREKGGLQKEVELKNHSVLKLERDLTKSGAEHEEAKKRWRELYPDEEPQYAPLSEDLQQARLKWMQLEEALKSRLAEVGEQYELPASDERPERLAFRLLQLMLPNGLELSQVESECRRLHNSLRDIERKVRGRVEDFRSSIESDIRKLKSNLEKANQVLSKLYFGNIQKIVLKADPLPSYNALRKLKADQLNLFTSGDSIDLREFVERVREFIRKESNMLLSEEDLTDYKSYVRITFEALDKDGIHREKGFSTGETLGINLALCFTVLHLLRMSEGNRGLTPGMLLLAMDEAERLDARALMTVGDLLDKVACQLVIASPRPVKISDSLCHIFAPLPQGVTSIALYRKGEEEESHISNS